jgi:hypothetical protein
MEHNNSHIETKLSELLGRFVKKESLTPQLVTISYEFLFGNISCLFTVRDTELYDAIIYLKEIMNFNHLHDINDILCYYERKKKSITMFIDNSITNNLSNEDHDQYSFCRELNWEKSCSELAISNAGTKQPVTICPDHNSQYTNSPFLPNGINSCFLNKSECIKNTRNQVEQT